jgi:hypothetical protein
MKSNQYFRYSGVTIAFARANCQAQLLSRFSLKREPGLIGLSTRRIAMRQRRAAPLLV